MKFMDRISRLLGGGAKADPKRNRLSINLAEVAPTSERQSLPQSEISSPPEHSAPAEKGDIAAEIRLIEPSIPAVQHDDIEDLGYLTPSEIRVILGGTETTLRQFAASPRLFAKDIKGDTALHIAARTGNLVQCDLFVRAGSNPAALNNEGQTPADLALIEGHHLVAQLLSSLLGEGRQNKELEGPQVSPEIARPATVLGESGKHTLSASDKPVSDNENLGTHEGDSNAIWSEDRVQRLRTLWAEGESAGQIARELGGVSRNAVLNKVARLGMPKQPRSAVDPSEDQQTSIDCDDLSHPPEKPRIVAPRSVTHVHAQRSHNTDGKLAQGVMTSANPVQVEELDNLLHFEAEEDPEEFLYKAARTASSGTFVAVLNSSPAVFNNDDADWELDLSPVSIAGEGIGSSNVEPVPPSGDRDFLQIRNRGRQSVKKAVVQTGTRTVIDPEVCLFWAEEILAKERCSLEDIDRIVANCEGNGDLEELRVNLQRNLEAAGFSVDQVPSHDADLWDCTSDVSPDELADAIEAALTRRTRLPGTQRFLMEKSEELQILEPMMRAKQELQLGILASNTAVETILDFVGEIRAGSRDPSSVSLRTIIPSRPGHAETSEVMAAALALRSWHSTGRVMDGKRRREALAALEALDLTISFQKELVRILQQSPFCQAEASRLEAEILVFETANERLVREHLPYVRRFASRNVKEGEDPEDVFQVAFMGLQRSTRRFDPERGYRFLIYATYWMRQAITRWRADEAGMIRIPVHRNDKITKLDRALDKLDVRVSAAVADHELAKELEWTIEEVRQLRTIPRKADYPVSFEDWDNILPEPSEVDVFDEVETERIVTDALSELPQRQAEIIRMRFGIGRDSEMTLEEIGQIYGVTRERIRQIEAKALNHLSHPARLRRLRALVGFEGREKTMPRDLAPPKPKKPSRKSPQEKRSSPWTEERLNQLKQLWAEGMSAAEIAENLGDTSRNAVIGKLNRLGLSESGR